MSAEREQGNGRIVAGRYSVGAVYNGGNAPMSDLEDAAGQVQGDNELTSLDDIIKEAMRHSPMMEIWVSRVALETVVRAAASYSDENPPMVDDAIEAVQEAVDDAFEDPLSTEPL